MENNEPDIEDVLEKPIKNYRVLFFILAMITITLIVILSYLTIVKPVHKGSLRKR